MTRYSSSFTPSGIKDGNKADPNMVVPRSEQKTIAAEFPDTIKEQHKITQDLLANAQDYINEWEKSFLASLDSRLNRYIPLSEKQKDKLEAITIAVNERMDEVETKRSNEHGT